MAASRTIFLHCDLSSLEFNDTTSDSLIATLRPDVVLLYKRNKLANSTDFELRLALTLGLVQSYQVLMFNVPYVREVSQGGRSGGSVLRPSCRHIMLGGHFDAVGLTDRLTTRADRGQRCCRYWNWTSSCCRRAPPDVAVLTQRIVAK